MQYEQRNQQVRSDTTRHLESDEAGAAGGVVEYLEGARRRSGRFAETSGRLREIHADIDLMGQRAAGRPTGVLSGGDVDIAYHYLGLGLAIIALLYSVLGTVFALHGGGTTLLATLQERWSVGPAAALAEVALHPRTLAALVLQAVVFVVAIGTRRNRQSWQHWAALIFSAALTYAGWSSLLLAYGTPTVLALSATIPAAVIGGALGWAVVRASSEDRPSRPVLLGVIAAGVLAGALGAASLIHWAGLLMAWSVDQAARRQLVVG